MFIVTNHTTSPIILKRVAQLAVEMDALIQSPLPITREDDWALTRASAALRDMLDADNASVRRAA